MSKYHSPEEEKELILKAKAGDTAARNCIIMNMMPLIYKLSRKAGKRFGYEADELVGVAVAQIAEKFNKFDPNAGFKIITYLGTIAENAMLDYALRRDKLIYTPNWCHDDELKKKASRARIVGSLSCRIGAGEDATELVVMVADEKAAIPEEEASKNEDLAWLRRCLGKLKGIQKEVLLDRAQGLTLKEIGEKHGVTREAIRQTEIKAEQQLAWLMRQKRVIVYPKDIQKVEPPLNVYQPDIQIKQPELPKVLAPTIPVRTTNVQPKPIRLRVRRETVQKAASACCPWCQSFFTRKFGTTRNGSQRHQCNSCWRTFKDWHNVTDNRNLNPEKTAQVATMLLQAHSYRCIERNTGVHRNTIMSLARKNVALTALQQRGNGWRCNATCSTRRRGGGRKRTAV